jgi:quercetin dioxygenase-like cupin family protein
MALGHHGRDRGGDCDGVSVAAGFGLTAGEGEAFWFAGQLATVKISGAETEGRWTLVEFEAPPGNGPPLHVHRDDDESFYVIDGEITFYLGDAVIEARAGSFAFAPRGVPHTFVVGGEAPARYLVVSAPAGFERFVSEASVPAESRTIPPPPDGPPDAAALVALAARHGIEILGPPGPPARG